VLRICVEETRLFVTKNRAPFLVCLEVYRPEELLIYNREEAQGTKKQFNILLDTANKQLSQPVIVN